MQQTTHAFTQAIDENDFDRMHKMIQTVYGWVDDPPLLPDIILVVEKLTKTNSGELFDLEMVIKSVSLFRQQEKARLKNSEKKAASFRLTEIKSVEKAGKDVIHSPTLRSSSKSR